MPAASGWNELNVTQRCTDTELPLVATFLGRWAEP
jgi:hypothetical protein